MTGESIDLARVREELEAEVRALRASGELPTAFERELDAAFARHAPIGASQDLDAVLAAAEEAAAIDATAPVASPRPAVRLVKRGIGRGMGWYQAWIAHQVTVFAATSVRALRLLGERTAHLESVIAASARARAELSHLAPPPTPMAVVRPVTESFRGVEGRVLVAEAGDGAILDALVAAGVDAYGAEPSAAPAGTLADRGFEVRADAALVHLHAVPDGDLAGLVLVGAIHHLPSGEQVELIDVASARVGPGGRVVVVGLDEAAWRTSDPVAADLAGGHPLRRETWTHLLSVRGLTVLTEDDQTVGSGDDPWILVASVPTGR